MFMKWQTAAIEAKNKALYAEEAAFNEEIARAIDVMHAGLSVPETVKTVNTAERALRAVEAEAATRKAAHARPPRRPSPSCSFRTSSCETSRPRRYWPARSCLRTLSRGWAPATRKSSPPPPTRLQAC